MGTIGTSQSQRELLEQNQKIFDDVIELEKGANIHRVIQGPQKTNALFYPTIVEAKDEKGQTSIKATFKVLNFLDVPPIINSMITAEQNARKAIDNKEELGFRIQTRWWYLAINVLNKTDIKVKPVRYPTGVKDDITKIETRLDVKDNHYLLDGHYFLYDILIEKTIDPSKPKRYGTSYNASIYGNNPYKQRIPANWLKADPGAIIQELGGMEKVFPAEFIDAIQSCDIVLEKILTPMNESQINDALQKFPINLLGRRSTEGGGLAFPQNPEFVEMLKSLGIPTVYYDSDSKKNIIDEGSKGVTLKKPAEESKPAEEPKPVETQLKSNLGSSIKPLSEVERVEEPKPVEAPKVEEKPKSGLRGLKK